MADDKQQPTGNDPLMNNQWEEQQWQEKLNYAKSVMAGQQAEQSQDIAEAAAKRMQAKREAADDEGSDEDQENEWATRLAMAKNAGKGQGGFNNAPGSNQAAQIINELDLIDRQIAALNQKTGSDYVQIYLFLTVSAVVVDILQTAANITFFLSLAASGIGIFYGVIRHYGLKYANRGASASEHSQILRRTFISSAVSVVPYVNLLPESTAFMIREWTIKKASIAGTSEEIRKLRENRKKLASSLPK
jgi:hypothetical protein